MHPLEQLRFVARGWESMDDFPVDEVAAVLAELAEQSPGSLLHACRRLIERFPSSGRLWWLSARALSAPDPVEGIWEATGELLEDPTTDQLAKALPAGASVELVGPADGAIVRALRRRRAANRRKKPSPGRPPGSEPRQALGRRISVFSVLAAGPEEVLLDEAAARQMRALAGSPVLAWAVVPRGVVLPGPLWDQLVVRAGAGRSVMSPGAFGALVGPGGLEGAAELLGAPGCPPVAELLGWRASSGSAP